MHKVSYCGSENSPDGTGYNDAPVGWREITEKEFVQSKFFQETPEYFEYKQIKQEGKPLLPVHLYWFQDKTGFGLVHDYWKGKVRFYRFGCAHDRRELSMDECHKRGIYHGGNCYHVTECKKCGHVYAYDSSG